MASTIIGHDQYRIKVDQLREVAAGKRGWVKIGHSEAAACGVSIGSLAMLARSLGLHVQRCGKNGWTAFRNA